MGLDPFFDPFWDPFWTPFWALWKTWVDMATNTISLGMGLLWPLDPWDMWVSHGTLDLAHRVPN